jgi:hypothetical protein
MDIFSNASRHVHKWPWTELSSLLSWILRQNAKHQHISVTEKTYPESRLPDRKTTHYPLLGAHERPGVPVKSTHTSSIVQSHFGCCGRVHDGFNGLVRATRSIHRLATTCSEAERRQFQHLLHTHQHEIYASRCTPAYRLITIYEHSRTDKT